LWILEGARRGFLGFLRGEEGQKVVVKSTKNITPGHFRGIRGSAYGYGAVI